MVKQSKFNGLWSTPYWRRDAAGRCGWAKNAACCAFLFLLAANVSNVAHAVAFQWPLNAEGTLYEMRSSLTDDSNGNCYVTGRITTTNFVLGDVVLTNLFATQGDMFVAKITLSGSVLWARNVAGNGYSEGYAVAVDRDGNVFVVGHYAYTNLVLGGTTLTNPAPNSTDIFLVKYSPNGQELWARRAGGTNSDFAQGITVDDLGNCIITGHFYSSTIQFGQTNLVLTPSPNSGSDLFIAKYNPAGDVVWAEKFGGSGYDIGSGVAADASGNIYLTGYFEKTISFGSNSLTTASAGYDPFITKLSSNGIVAWAKSGSGSGGSDFGWKAAVDGFGNCFIVGFFESPFLSFGTNVLTRTSGSQNFYLVKYDSGGNVLWTKSAGNAAYARGADVAVDVLGNAYVTGYFGGSNIAFDSLTLTNSGSSDAFIVKYSPVGGVVWGKKIGGSNADSGWSVAVEKPDSVFISGSFRSSQVDFGTFQITNSGPESDDLFLTKLALTPPTLAGGLYGGFFRLTVSGDPGESYSIEYTGNLIDWQTFITYTSPNETVSFADFVGTNTVRFYRAFVK